MEYGLLGPLAVRANGTELPLDGGRQWAALAILLMRPNELVATETLVDELWGARPTATSTKAVHGYISRLRKSLGRDVIETRAPGYVLRLERDALDVKRFERLHQRGSFLLARGTTEEARRVLGEALALWRGPALADFRYESFARVEAARLEELRLAALEERIEADLAIGRHAELVGELESLIAVQPHRERPRGQLMLALYRSGRQRDALDAYRDARAALDELGLAPGSALRQLERQILTQDTTLELPPQQISVGSRERVALPGPLVPASPFPFVGRNRELTELRALHERATAGEGSFVLVAGEAGSGKTRLVRELAHEAAGRGSLVLYGASDAAVSTPYQPLREWLEFLLHVSDPVSLGACLDGDGAPLTRLVPRLGALKGTPAWSPGDPDNDRYLLRSAAVELLRRLSGMQPVLVVADDLHWADVETLQLLRRLARIVPEARLLVLAAYRGPGERIDPALGDTLADLARLDAVTRISLGNLSPEEMREFVRVAAEAEPGPELLIALAELTDGAPLLLCELWRDLSASGAVEVSESGVRLTRRLAELRGPERIVELVQHRLSRLAPETTALVELAAVAGPQFELRVVADAAGLDPSALVAPLDQARRNGMVEELPEPTGACRFTHELIRRAVYDRIPAIRRAELHQHYADSLEQLAGERAADYGEILGHHLEQAYRYRSELGAPDDETRALGERAATHLVASAERAGGERGDHRAAASLLERALAVGLADPHERTRSQLHLSGLLALLGRPAERAALLAEAADTATRLGDPGLITRARLQTAAALIHDPEPDLEQAPRVIEEALETMRELGDERGFARELGQVQWLYSGICAHQGRLADSLAHLEHALAAAEAAGLNAARRQAIGATASALYLGPVPVGEAIRRCEELILKEPPLHHRVGDARVTGPLAALLAMAGRTEEALELAQRSRAGPDELGIVRPWLRSRDAVAEAKEYAGEGGAAIEEREAACQQFEEIYAGRPDAAAMSAAYKLALVYCDAGRWEDAERRLAYGPELPIPTQFRQEAVLRLAGRARVATHHRRHDEAVTLATKAVELADQSDMLNLRGRVREALAEVQRRNGAAAEAEAAVAEAIRLYEAKGNVAAAASLRAAAN